jgi:YggT family protein
LRIAVGFHRYRAGSAGSACAPAKARLHGGGSAAAAARGKPMRALLDVLFVVLNVYTWVVIASAIFSWLYAFGVVNPRNQFVAAIGRMLYQLTEPALRPIRRFVPSFGGLDISPVILLLIIFLIERIIAYYIYPYVF